MSRVLSSLRARSLSSLKIEYNAERNGGREIGASVFSGSSSAFALEQQQPFGMKKHV